MTILHLAPRFTEAMDISRTVDRVDCVDMRIMCEGHASRFKSCQPTEVARADHGCHLLACIDSSVAYTTNYRIIHTVTQQTVFGLKINPTFKYRAQTHTRLVSVNRPFRREAKYLRISESIVYKIANKETKEECRPTSRHFKTSN